MTEYGNVTAQDHFLVGEPGEEWPVEILFRTQAAALKASAEYGFDFTKVEMRTMKWQDHWGDWHVRYGWYCNDEEPHGPVEP